MTVPGQAPFEGKHRLLIVDDHPVMCKGLAHILGVEPDLTVCGQAEDAAKALAVLASARFDLVILDISLKGVSGIDLLKDIKIRYPQLPVLVLSMHDEMLYAERALRAGARGYVMKQEATENIVSAIRRVLAGQLYVSEAVNGRILQRLMDNGKNRGSGLVTDALSNRELEVFQFIGKGHGTRDIAAEMHVSVKTVETYRAHIKEKLQIKSAPELMRFAVDWVSNQGVV